MNEAVEGVCFLCPSEPGEQAGGAASRETHGEGAGAVPAAEE